MSAEAVAALRRGELAVLPTDTVYGLCALPEEEPVRRLYELKERPAEQPTALLYVDVKTLLREFEFPAVKALLPGPFTVVVPNPEHRYPWLTGSRPDAIGVRVPAPGPGTQVLRRTGPLAATSANLRGGREPRRLADVPAEIAAACGAVVDAGELPGLVSTVLDLTGPEPVVLREGAVPAEQALSLVRDAQ